MPLHCNMMDALCRVLYRASMAGENKDTRGAKLRSGGKNCEEEAHTDQHFSERIDLASDIRTENAWQMLQKLDTKRHDQRSRTRVS